MECSLLILEKVKEEKNKEWKKNGGKIPSHLASFFFFSFFLSPAIATWSRRSLIHGNYFYDFYEMRCC